MPLSKHTKAKIRSLNLSDLGTPPSLKNALKAIEGHFVNLALKASNGEVTAASRQLGYRHHQSLISVITVRHPDAPRKPVRQRRPRKSQAEPKT